GLHRRPEGGDEGLAEGRVHVAGEVGQGAAGRVAAEVDIGHPEQVGRLVGLEAAVDDGADLVVGQDLDLDLGAPGRLEVGGDLLEGRDLLVRAPGGEGGGAGQLTAAVTAPRLRP